MFRVNHKVRLLIIFLFSGLQITRQQNYSKSKDFITSLVTKTFSNCTLHILHWNEPEFQEFIDEILLKSEQSVLVVNPAKSAHVLKTSNHTFRAHSDQCTFFITLFSNIYKDFLKSDISNYHLTNQNSLNRKGRNQLEYYCFLTRSELISTVLRSEIAKNMKYKIAVSENASSGRLFVHSLDLYQMNGHPQIVEINSKDQSISSIFPDFTQNFNGHQLRISSPMRATFRFEIKCDDSRGKNCVPLHGDEYYLLKQIVKKFNITFKVFPSSGFGLDLPGSTGRLIDGKWTGCVGDILTDRADLGFVTAQTYVRNAVVEFTTPKSYETLTFTTGRPKIIYSITAIFGPFRFSAWILLLGSILLSLLCLTVLEYSWKRDKSCWSCCWSAQYMMATILQQTPTRSPRRLRSKLFCSIWLIFSIVISAAYRCRIISFMVFPAIEKLPENMSELLTSSFKWGLEGSMVGGAGSELLKNSKNAIYAEVYKKVTPEMDTLKCFKRGIEEEFACITYRAMAEYIMHRNFTDRSRTFPLVLSTESTYSISVGWIMPVNSIYAQGFNKVIRASMDLGLLNKWGRMDLEHVHSQRLQWEKKNNFSEYSSREEGRPVILQMRNFKGVWVILAVGVLLAVIVFIFEITMCRVYSESNNRNKIGPATLINLAQAQSLYESRYRRVPLKSVNVTTWL